MPKKTKKIKKAEKGIAPFDPNVDIEVVKENPDGSWVGRIITAKATLKCAGRIFKSEGNTLEDALQKIKISGGVRSLSVLTVQQGDRKRTKILNASLTNKLFGHVSNTAKLIGLKQVKQMFP